MLLSSGPLILIFEPRPVDRRTLLNDVERIVPLAVHIIKWLVLVLILPLATFPTIRKCLLYPVKTLFSPLSFSRRSINFCALGRVVSREIYSVGVFSTSYLRYPHRYSFPGLP